jgi:hypothetical protein
MLVSKQLTDSFLTDPSEHKFIQLKNALENAENFETARINLETITNVETKLKASLSIKYVENIYNGLMLSFFFFTATSLAYTTIMALIFLSSRFLETRPIVVKKESIDSFLYASIMSLSVITTAAVFEVRKNKSVHAKILELKRLAQQELDVFASPPPPYSEASISSTSQSAALPASVLPFPLRRRAST